MVGYSYACKEVGWMETVAHKLDEFEDVKHTLLVMCGLSVLHV
jgi:hypothetical protein